jgi:hypothetical protein
VTSGTGVKRKIKKKKNPPKSLYALEGAFVEGGLESKRSFK